MKYFSADWHIDFEKSMGFPQRKSFTLQNWQNLLLEITNSVLQKDDILYMLGDFAERPEIWRPKIKCKNIFLIHGNHDPPISKCEKVFGNNKVKQIHEIKIQEQACVLCHYPLLIWPQSHNNSIHLYGHLHDQRTDYWAQIPQLWGMKSLDVCPESYKRYYGTFGIFSEDQILEIINEKPGHDKARWYIENFGEL